MPTLTFDTTTPVAPKGLGGLMRDHFANGRMTFAIGAHGGILDLGFWAGKRLDAGTVWLNMNLMSTMEAPFGGTKNSGIGREYGAPGLREYMKIKNQMLYIDSEEPDFYGFSQGEK